MITTWKPIPGFKGYYEINLQGQIRSRDRDVPVREGTRFYPGRSVPQHTNEEGYVYVKLSRDGKTYTRYVHHLMALTFLPNPDNRCCVNHRNGVKGDNRFGNLEWATHQENIIHAYRVLGRKNTPIPVVDWCNDRIYGSKSEAAREMGISEKKVTQLLEGQGEKRWPCLIYLRDFDAKKHLFFREFQPEYRLRHASWLPWNRSSGCDCN